LEDISKGLPIPKAAQRYALPEILIWSLKLRDLDEQAKLDALGIKIHDWIAGASRPSDRRNHRKATGAKATDISFLFDF
jgi:hypothetical protein